MNTYLIIPSEDYNDTPIRDSVEKYGASWNTSYGCFLKTDLTAKEIYDAILKERGKCCLKILITKVNASEEELYGIIGMRLLTWVGFKYKTE